MFRRLIVISLSALILNFLFEEAHSVLYISYKGAAITNLILFRAALFDAAVVTLFYFLFSRLPERLQKVWLLLAALTLFAVLLEKWALAEERWVYAGAMPIIPLLGVGLTPTIQLGILGYLSLRISEWFRG